jgi:hypothetical protein
MDHHPPRSSRVLRPRTASEFASFAQKERDIARYCWLLLAESRSTRRHVAQDRAAPSPVE